MIFSFICPQLPAFIISDFIGSRDSRHIFGCEWPAKFITPTRLVGHIGLDIDTIDGSALIEVVSTGIAIIGEPFGITDLALFAGIGRAAKRVAVDVPVDFHTCTSRRTCASHIGGTAVFPGSANSTVCIVDADHIAICTVTVENGCNLFIGRLVGTQVASAAMAARTLFITGAGFAIGLFLDVTNAGKTMPGQTLDIHRTGFAVDLAGFANIGRIAVFAHAFPMVGAGLANSLAHSTDTRSIAIGAFTFCIRSTRFAIGLGFVCTNAGIIAIFAPAFAVRAAGFAIVFFGRKRIIITETIVTVSTLAFCVCGASLTIGFGRRGVGANSVGGTIGADALIIGGTSFAIGFGCHGRIGTNTIRRTICANALTVRGT